MCAQRLNLSTIEQKKFAKFHRQKKNWLCFVAHWQRKCFKTLSSACCSSFSRLLFLLQFLLLFLLLLLLLLFLLFFLLLLLLILLLLFLFFFFYFFFFVFFFFFLIEYFFTFKLWFELPNAWNALDLDEVFRSVPYRLISKPFPFDSMSFHCDFPFPFPCVFSFPFRFICTLSFALECWCSRWDCLLLTCLVFLS